MVRFYCGCICNIDLVLYIIATKFYSHDISVWFLKVAGKTKLPVTEQRPGSEEDELLKEVTFSSKDQDKTSILCKIRNVGICHDCPEL